MRLDVDEQIPNREISGSIELARILLESTNVERGQTEAGYADRILDLAKNHGVHALLYSLLDKSSVLKHTDTLKQAAFHQAALFQLQDKELERVCAGLYAANVPYLLVKGAALCYQIYATPDIRPRVDTDVFIDKSSLADIRETLSSLGYESVLAHDGGLVSYQTSMRYTDECQVTHTVDIHWNLSNRHEYRDILSFEFVNESAVTLRRFAFPVRAPNYGLALCLACLHLVGHHSENPRLIWYYDMNLLLQRMRQREIEEFMELIGSRKLENVTCQALTALDSHFGNESVSTILEKLGYGDGIPMPEESRLALLSSNIRSFPTLSTKCKYLFTLAFPPADYIQNRFEPASKFLVPWYYVYRIYKGTLKTVGRR